MDTQHQKIEGYRDLDEGDIDRINIIKRKAEEVRVVVEALGTNGKVDQRWVAIAKTDLQKGFMSLVRAIAKPESF